MSTVDLGHYRKGLTRREKVGLAALAGFAAVVLVWSSMPTSRVSNPAQVRVVYGPGITLTSTTEPDDGS